MKKWLWLIIDLLAFTLFLIAVHECYKMKQENKMLEYQVKRCTQINDSIIAQINPKENNED